MLKRSSLFCILALFLFTNYVNAQVIKAVADDDWSLPTTWDLGRIPLSTDMVIIEGFDVRLDVSASVVSIQIKNSATGGNTRLQVQGNGIVFNVVGDMNINAIDEDYSVIFQIETTDSVYIGGNLNISRNNTNKKTTRLHMLNDSKLTISGNFNFNYYNAGSGEADYDIYMQDNSQLDVIGKTTLATHDGIDLDFIMEDASQTILRDSLKLLLLGGLETAITVNHSAHLQLLSHAYLLNSGGSGTNHCKLKCGDAGGKMTITGNVTMESTASQEDIKLESKSAAAEFNVLGDITMNAFDEQDVIIDIKLGATFKLGGNLTRLTPYGYLYMDTDASFVFNGTVPQVIPETKLPGSGLDDFNYENVSFENTSGSPITLSEDISIYKTLAFTTGNIQTSPSALLIIEEDAVVTGTSKAAYVIGPMVKRGKTNNQNFIFPVGDNGIYAPIEIEKISSSLVEYTAQYMGCPPPTISSVNNPLKKLNPQGYWTLDRNDANAVGNVTLHWDDANNTGLTDLNSLVVSYYNTITSSWFSLGQGVTTGSIGPAASGSISNDSGCPPPTIAGIFTMGSTDENENALLPVELANFSAYEDSDNSMISLEWETVSETNSDYFIIEKSYDGITFQEIGHVEAAKNSSSAQFYHARDYEPVKGNNYYRIQMVDQDRTMSFSDLANVFINDQEEDMIIFPNPVKDYIKLYNKNLTGQIVNVNIYDMAGKCVYSNRLESEPGILQLYTSDMSLTKSGIYFLNFEDKGKVFSLKFYKMPN